MKKTTLLFLFIFAIARIQAQNYQITFAGTGSSTTVDSVTIENISQCTYSSIGGSDVLNLAAIITGINEVNVSSVNTLNIYPNPMTGNCLIDFEATAQGETSIELYDITGKEILKEKELLSAGHQTFSLNGINSGIYFLKIGADKYSYMAKIVSNTTTAGIAEIKHIAALQGKEKQNISSNVGKTRGLESSRSIIAMQYNAGDTLKLTGKSGFCRTIVMLIPTQSQKVTFNFVYCADADSNHYAVVQIGSQLWMAENLKTTRYRDGSAIPNIQDSASWGSATAGAYCDYHNLTSEGQQYGHLYNFHAASDPRNIAPVGWHVSTNSEWNKMEVFLDKTVDSTALGSVGLKIGKMLKENCNTRWAYLDTTWGTNFCGFTALCTNYRTTTGAWSQGANNSHDDGFWTSTPSATNNGYAWFRSCRWCDNDLFVFYVMYDFGYSIRCVHD